MADQSKTEFVLDRRQPIITMRRTFEAPRRIVFEAATEGEHLKRWYGPAHLEIVSAETDVRVGGRWRVVHRDPGDGTESGFHGMYLEVDRPRRIAYTWIFEGDPDVEVIEAAAYDEVDHHTIVTATSTFPTMAARERHLGQGAEAGARESWDRLADVIRGLYRPHAPLTLASRGLL